jgi:hypothetical protein
MSYFHRQAGGKGTYAEGGGCMNPYARTPFYIAGRYVPLPLLLKKRTKGLTFVGARFNQKWLKWHEIIYEAL